MTIHSFLRGFTFLTNPTQPGGNHEATSLPSPSTSSFHAPPLRHQVHSQDHLHLLHRPLRRRRGYPTFSAPFRRERLRSPPPWSRLQSHPNPPPTNGVVLGHFLRPLRLPPILLHHPYSIGSLRNPESPKKPFPRIEILPILPLTFSEFPSRVLHLQPRAPDTLQVNISSPVRPSPVPPRRDGPQGHPWLHLDC